MCRAMEAMAQSFGPVRPAQTPPIVIEEREPKAPEMQPGEIVQNLGALAKVLGEAFKNGSAGGGG